jgi:hypothetical protein
VRVARVSCPFVYNTRGCDRRRKTTGTAAIAATVIVILVIAVVRHLTDNTSLLRSRSGAAKGLLPLLHLRDVLNFLVTIHDHAQ